MSDACAALLETGDPDRFAAARLAGPLAGRLTALYAFNLELARIPALVSEPMLGEIRLQWWRDVVGEIFDGKPPRGHEVAAPLAAVIRDCDLPRDLFESMLDARSYDIHGPSFADRALFDAYVDGSAAGLTRLAARALGGGDAADAAARDFGWAAGAANLIAALPAIYGRGGDPIPAADPADRALLANGKTPAPIADSIAAIARDGVARIAAARARRGDVAATVRPAFFAGWQAERILVSAARPGFDVFANARVSEFRRRGGLAWRVMTGRW